MKFYIYQTLREQKANNMGIVSCDEDDLDSDFIPRVTILASNKIYRKGESLRYYEGYQQKQISSKEAEDLVCLDNNIRQRRMQDLYPELFL